MTGENAEQTIQWDGIAGERWVADADRYDRVNRAFGERIVAAAAAQPGERVLDVGCGNGALALALAPMVVPGAVHGLDISGPMLGEARRRAEEAGVGNVTFEKGDAQVHPLPKETFDLVVSRFGVMFFDDPLAAFTNLASTLRPGGRVVFTSWQDVVNQQWLMVPAAAALEHVPLPALGEPGPGPFSMADREATATLLRQAGLDGVDITELVAPMRLGESIADVVAFMGRTDFADVLFADVPPAQADAGWNAIAHALEPHAGDDGIELNGAAWLVTARRPA